jgi:hypothetical protein
MANSNDLKKYHFLYKTTNLLNNKFYIGIHSTNNLNDGYLGSGKKLKRSINKYGKENFKIEILEFFDRRELLVDREKEIVNEDLIRDVNCMNLKPGGLGGLNSELHAKNFHKAGGRAVLQLLSKRHTDRLKLDEIYRNEWIYKTKLGVIRSGYQMGSFYGKKHTKETKQKMSESKKKKYDGSNNPQYGKCWITNGIQSKMIKRDEIIPDGWRFGRVLFSKL